LQLIDNVTAIWATVSVNGYDAYILENETFVFFHSVNGINYRQTYSLPGGNSYSDILAFGSAHEVFYLIF